MITDCNFSNSRRYTVRIRCINIVDISETLVSLVGSLISCLYLYNAVINLSSFWIGSHTFCLSSSSKLNFKSPKIVLALPSESSDCHVFSSLFNDNSVVKISMSSLFRSGLDRRLIVSLIKNPTPPPNQFLLFVGGRMSAKAKSRAFNVRNQWLSRLLFHVFELFCFSIFKFL